MLLKKLYLFIIMEQIDKYTRTYDSVLNSRQVAVDSKYREPLHDVSRNWYSIIW